MHGHMNVKLELIFMQFFIQSPVTPHLQGPNTSLSTLFLKCIHSFTLMDSSDLHRHQYTPLHNIV